MRDALMDARVAPRHGSWWERRLLQVAITLGALVPLGAGIAGVVLGPGMFGLEAGPPPAMPDLFSHFAYLSGLLLALGLLFLAIVPAIESRSTLFRSLAFVVVIGGLARLENLFTVGTPGLPQLLGLGMELVATPLLVVWQARVARGAVVIGMSKNRSTP